MEEKLNAILENQDAMARIMELANQLSGNTAAPEKSKPTPPPSDGIDPKILARFLPLIKEAGNTDSPAAQLLYALRPYMKEERQDKVARAIKLAHIAHIAKQFLAEGGLNDV